MPLKIAPELLTLIINECSYVSTLRLLSMNFKLSMYIKNNSLPQLKISEYLFHKIRLQTYNFFRFSII